MCIVIVKTQIHPSGRREVVEERQYCISASAGQLCDRLDRRELPVERIVAVEPAQRSLTSSWRYTLERSYASRPRIVVPQDEVTLLQQDLEGFGESDRRHNRTSPAIHIGSRRRFRDCENVHEVLPEAPSPPRYSMETLIRYTHCSAAPPRGDFLSVHVPENETRSTQSHIPPSPRSQSRQTMSVSNRNSRIDSAYASSEHTTSPSSPRLPIARGTRRPRHREPQFLDDQVPGERATPHTHETNAAPSSYRVRDIEAEYERAQDDIEKMNNALRYMSFSDGRDYRSRPSSSQQKRDKKDTRIYHRRNLTD